MSDSFTKLFSSITESTIWDEDSDTRIVWVTMLAMADRDGYVGASIPGLAARARVSVQKTEAAIEKFLSPDKYSRTKEHDGRRIEESNRGWTLLNHGKFRDGDSAAPPVPADDGKSKVYFIRAGNAIRVATSKNPWARLNTLKDQSPTTPTLLGHFAGTAEDAKHIQDQIEAHRINREWFAASPEVMRVIHSLLGTTNELPVATGSELPKLQQEAEAEAEADAEADAESEGEAEGTTPDDLPELLPVDVIHAVRVAVEKAHPDLTFWLPGQFADRQAREFCDSIPRDKHAEAIKALPVKAAAYAAQSDEWVVKKAWHLKEFLERWNWLASARPTKSRPSMYETL